MKVYLRASIRMLAGLAMTIPAIQAVAQAPGQIPAGYAYYNLEDEMSRMTESVTSSEAASNSSVSCSCGDAACAGGCGLLGGSSLSGRMGGGVLRRPGRVFFGMDYLNLRASVSESTAFVERDVSSANPVDTFHQANFDYGSSYRLYGGYRFEDCCGEVMFSYARYRSEAALTSDAATGTVQYNAPFEVNAITPGSQIMTDFDVDAQVFDVDFGRIIPLGSALGDCGCDWCPAWDIKWFFGLRYADIDWVRDTATTDTAASTLSSRSTMDFHGGGLRAGIDGRRYIGRNGNFSIFARGAISLLIGDVDYLTTNVTSTPGIVISQRANFKRVIPVADIELGGSVHVTDNFTVSGGYLLSAWHDLGMGDQYFAALTPIIYDDANILGFDGFFVRAEVAY